MGYRNSSVSSVIHLPPYFIGINYFIVGGNVPGLWKFEGESEECDRMDSKPMCFKIKEGVRDNFKLIPDWQDKLRS